MSLTYRSSFSFSRPSHYTISHVQIEDVLDHHKKRLSINQRSTSRDNNYKTQRLCVQQVRTIENLAKTTKVYSLNSLLKNYHKNWDEDNIENALKFNNTRPNSQHSKGLNRNFQTIEPELLNTISGICPQKMKLFKQGVNYRSKQRSKGTGVRKVNMKDLRTYFNRTPQQESCQLLQTGFHAKKFNTIESSRLNSKSNRSQFKFNRVKSHRIAN